MNTFCKRLPHDQKLKNIHFDSPNIKVNINSYFEGRHKCVYLLSDVDIHFHILMSKSFEKLLFVGVILILRLNFISQNIDIEI